MKRKDIIRLFALGLAEDGAQGAGDTDAGDQGGTDAGAGDGKGKPAPAAGGDQLTPEQIATLQKDKKLASENQRLRAVRNEAWELLGVKTLEEFNALKAKRATGAGGNGDDPDPDDVTHPAATRDGKTPAPGMVPKSEVLKLQRKVDELSSGLSTLQEDKKRLEKERRENEIVSKLRDTLSDSGITTGAEKAALRLARLAVVETEDGSFPSTIRDDEGNEFDISVEGLKKVLPKQFFKPQSSGGSGGKTPGGLELGGVGSSDVEKAVDSQAHYEKNRDKVLADERKRIAKGAIA